MSPITAAMTGGFPAPARDLPDMTRDPHDMTRDTPGVTGDSHDMTRDTPDMTGDSPDVTGDTPDMTGAPKTAKTAKKSTFYLLTFKT